MVNQRLNICESVAVNDCFEFEDFQNCKICNTGFFLDSNKKCVKNPIAGVRNCEVYSSVTFCVKCQNRYVRIDSSTCEQATNIDYCD